MSTPKPSLKAKRKPTAHQRQLQNLRDANRVLRETNQILAMALDKAEARLEAQSVTIQHLRSVRPLWQRLWNYFVPQPL